MPEQLSSFLAQLRQRWPELLVSLVISLAGALLFVFLTLPLPWLIGPVVATTIAAMSGIKVWMPNELRLPMFFVLGASFGLNIQPGLGDQVGLWIPSIVMVTIYVAVGISLATAYLHWVAGFNPVTAYFSATPGGLITMLALGESYGGDIRSMALVQSVRLLSTILIIPMAFRIIGGYVPPETVWATVTLSTASFEELFILAVLCILGYGISIKLKIPAPYLLGPMIAVGTVKLLGFIDTAVPPPLFSLAMLCIGTSIGTSFRGIQVKEVVTTLLHGFFVGALMILLAVGFATTTQMFNGGSMKALILAFAPGGFAEMALVASGLGIEVTFVIAHQLARYLMVLALAPLVGPFLKRPG
ncbi:MAG: AbrB family transcriptional regulator [Rhodospirillaceae bacterium]|nr:AbrB family transcriptional regulator [Rhodospirillaceae bacterium]MBT5940216.1 AbrB family transcriptional regulator [Rhodospirillaceae bacterium]MBT7268325.1 AbrB family transcriptional regulator [Rhodospirillaceae bacterium]